MAKVVMITGSFPYDKCGVGDYTKLLCKELYINDIDLSIITSCKDIKLEENISVYNDIENWSIKNIKYVLNQIKSSKPDIVHIQYPTKAYGKKILINILPILLKLNRIKVITTIHEYSDNSFLGKMRANMNILFSDIIVVVDPRYKIDINKNLLFKKKHIKYINIASNIPKSLLDDNEKEVKKTLIVGNSNKKIMSYFGFIHEKKGIEYILKAMKKLKEKDNLNAKFLIIGELNKYNKYHEELLKLIEDYDLHEDIVITGYLDDNEVADFLSISDFVLLPFKDGFSPKNGSAIAALQEGKNVITTKSKYLEEDFDGLTFIDKYDNIEQLVKCIEYNLKRTKNVGSNKNTFNWNYVAKAHIKLYEELLK